MDDTSTAGVKGPYPLFDNVTAIFSATPVITRTATYVYACTEWVEDAFQGKEFLHEIYSRLLNPTSICLANHIVDLEAGPEANEYFAWNFNSGMAAIDATLANLLGNGQRASRKRLRWYPPIAPLIGTANAATSTLPSNGSMVRIRIPSRCVCARSRPSTRNG